MIPLPSENRTLSPYTGWTREHWTTVADAVLDGAARHASPAQSLIRYPGRPGGYGTEVDALEGFTRTFMLAAFRIAGDPGGTEALAERYLRGFAAGVDRRHPERWLRPDEVDQAKVEAAALALGLHLTRDTIWVRMSEQTQQQTIDYLAAFVGGDYPPNNWAWFRIMVEQFLKSVGGPFSVADREQDLALLDSFDLPGGWIADGEGRNFDHYSGWALPFYPIFWGDMVADEPQHAERVARYRARLDEFLDDALHLIGRDGAPLFQGRSLTYRFATAGSAWAAAFHGGSRHDAGLLRRAASGQVSHFVSHGAPDADGILSLGWHHPWRALAQNYSGQGSPYWAAKGMVGLALPADHPVWTSVEQPLPIDDGPFARALVAPGWLATGTADGIVRIVNHGTDHRVEGALEPDAPLYAKLGYSTATAPVLSREGVHHPLDGTVALIRDGAPSHRSGFRVGETAALDEQTLVGSSSAQAHWPLELKPGEPDHGVGTYAVRTELGPQVDTVSVVRGAWEVRFVRVHESHDTVVLPLRVGGWALTAEDVSERAAGWAQSAGLASRIVALHAPDASEHGIRFEDDVTPLAGRTAIPWIETVPPTGKWLVFGIHLGSPASAQLVPTVTTDAPLFRITWGDDHSTDIRPDEATAPAFAP